MPSEDEPSGMVTRMVEKVGLDAVGKLECPERKGNGAKQMHELARHTT